MLQVLAQDLILRRQLGHLGQRSQRCGVAGAGVEDRVLDCVQRRARGVGQADANGVGAAVDDHRPGGGQAVEDCGGIVGNLAGREAEAACDDRIDLEARGRAGDGVVHAVLGVHHSGNLLDGVLHPGAELVQQGGIAAEELDLDGFRRVGEVADHVLQHLRELDVEGRLGLPDPLADVLHDLFDVAVAVTLEADGEVAGVGLGDGGEAHLQAGAAAGDLDLGRAAQDLLDVLEDAVGLGERCACRGEVVENKCALVHLGQQVGAKRVVGKPGGDDQREAERGESDGPGERPGERARVGAEDAPHHGAVHMSRVRGCKSRIGWERVQ